MARARIRLILLSTVMAAASMAFPLSAGADIGDAASLRAAILDLTELFGPRYPRGKEYLDQLDATESNSDAAPLDLLRRRALLDNPLVCEQPILFVTRRQYVRDHHNTATLFQTGEINTRSFTGGGALKQIDLSDGGKITTLLDVPEGIARDPEVHFDGRRILFSMREDMSDDYHLYEIGADGSDLRQLTSAPGVSDIDPLYLPDGKIAFSSTREPKFCMCNRHIMANLFRMDGDGANIHQIGKSTLFEGHGTLLPDGRILYDRWEYVDRNFGDAQGLWTAHPDGTRHAVYWGNNTWSPGGVIDARAIPGTSRVVCIFTSCHDRPWGAMTIIDRRRGLDGRGGVVRMWPADAIKLMAGESAKKAEYGFDNFSRVRTKFEDPYPLADTTNGAGAGNYFLCSRMTGSGEQMGIYVVDVFGNEVLVHAEGFGCFDPMPLAARVRPGVIPDGREFEKPAGYFYINDVYNGTHMADVQRGDVKAVRVVESPEKRFWSTQKWDGQGAIAPAMNWHDFNNKRILGTVPVEADGSAYFAVPADKYVFFQLLDEDGMMIQSMRSGTIVQAGETQGCVGCHDNRLAAPPSIRRHASLALTRPPLALEDWHGPARLFCYLREVQPVLDRHCVSCHDYGKDAGAVLNLAGDRTDTFNTSYNELWRKKMIQPIGAGPHETQPAYSWGSHASPLVAILREPDDNHRGVTLDRDSFDRLVTWIDINGPYYSTYASAYPDHLAGRSPLTHQQIQRLSELTGVPLKDLAHHGRNRGPQVSFDRPDLSPCLASFDDHTDPHYQEALTIIRDGRTCLVERPRADMPGFVPWATDRARQKKYLIRAAIETVNRRAIVEGRRVFDHSK